jgi:hypothetical protein
MDIDSMPSSVRPLYDDASGSCIPLFCINVGGTQPLAFLRSNYCTTTHTTSIRINVMMMMPFNCSFRNKNETYT